MLATTGICSEACVACCHVDENRPRIDIKHVIKSHRIHEELPVVLMRCKVKCDPLCANILHRVSLRQFTLGAIDGNQCASRGNRFCLSITCPKTTTSGGF